MERNTGEGNTRVRCPAPPPPRSCCVTRPTTGQGAEKSSRRASKRKTKREGLDRSGQDRRRRDGAARVPAWLCLEPPSSAAPDARALPPASGGRTAEMPDENRVSFRRRRRGAGAVSHSRCQLAIGGKRSKSDPREKRPHAGTQAPRSFEPGALSQRPLARPERAVAARRARCTPYRSAPCGCGERP